MLAPNTPIYLETSAVNYLADRYTWADGKATKVYHKIKDTRFYVSPVTIWEILLTNNEERKESLIHYLQNIGYEKLLNSPSEFIINYLLAGCPIVEKHYDFHSKIDIAATWLDICEHTNKTFVYDREDLKERSTVFLNVIKLVSKKIESIGLITSENQNQLEDQIWLDSMLRRLKGVDFEEMDDKAKKTLRISLLLVFYILCAGMEMDSTYIKKFWDRIGINDAHKRLDYILKNHEALIYRGPVVVPAQMALVQLEKGGKSTRGIFWDMLHSMYLIYTRVFLTNDEHFRKLRESHDHIIFKRVAHLDEVNWFTARVMDIDEEKIIK